MLARGLAVARQERGWSITELAARASLSAQLVRRSEAGIGSIATAEAIAAALEIRLSGLPLGATLVGQLRAQRERVAMTVSELATRTSLSRMTVRAVEAGSASMASFEAVIAVLAPGASFKAPPRASWARVTTRRGDDQFTPPEFMAKISAIFGSIELDPAWHEASNVVAERTYSLAAGQDGLTESWATTGLVWLNPPFSQLLRWLRKADAEWSAGRARTVVCLVPARTDSTYFHDRVAIIADVYLLRRRFRFTQLDGKPGNQAPFPLMLVLFGATEIRSARWIAARETP